MRFEVIKINGLGECFGIYDNVKMCRTAFHFESTALNEVSNYCEKLNKKYGGK